MSTPGSQHDLFEERFVLRDHREDIAPTQLAVQEAARDHGFDEAACFAVRLALEEALINAFRHGNRHDEGKAVTVTCRIEDGRLVLGVRDEGEGFDPTAVPDPTQDENIEIPAGRGIMLMRAYMTEVTFNDVGNEVTMTYERNHA